MERGLGDNQEVSVCTVQHLAGEATIHSFLPRDQCTGQEPEPEPGVRPGVGHTAPCLWLAVRGGRKQVGGGVGKEKGRAGVWLGQIPKVQGATSGGPSQD